MTDPTRAVRRTQAKKAYKSMKVKLRAVKVTFSNGEDHMVHEPRIQDISIFFRSLPALTELGKASEALEAIENGVRGIPVTISDDIIDGIAPLFAIMADISIEEFKELPLWDGMAILEAFGEFAPKNVETPKVD